MRKIDLPELRRIQLELLDDVHTFCETKGLKYSLCGGTLLGAVRHKGYIPWDDDIDLFMPRDDYESFARSFVSNANYVLDLRNVPYNRELCLKVCRKGSAMEDTKLRRTMWGINIDIFPIDGCPDDFIPLCKQVLAAREKLAQICPYYKSVNKKSLKVNYFIKYCLKRVCHPFSKGVISMKQRIHGMLTPFRLTSSKKGGCVLGSYGTREVLDANVFFEYTRLEFEGKEYPVIKKYHTYLSSLYGDYMTLPPVEKRVTHHLYTAYID